MDNFNYNTTPKKDNGFAIASLVLGIFSILCCCCISYVSIATGVLSIVFFIIDKQKNNSSNGMAIAGLVCSIFSIVICVASLIFTYSPLFKELMGMYESMIYSIMSDMNMEFDVPSNLDSSML